MLDDFIYGDTGIDDVIELCRQPRAFIEALLRVEAQHPLDMAVAGFRDFVAFAFELDRLLAASSEIPGLRQRFWDQYGYWLRKVEASFSTTIGPALDNLVRAGGEVLDAERGRDALHPRDLFERLFVRPKYYGPDSGTVLAK
jgi:hypothetical protein